MANTKNMALAALFAALTALCAWICIPVTAVAFTMQTFAIFLTLRMLGGKWGTAAIGVYLLLGAVGLPVFSGFRAGAGILLGPTGGYLWGFLVTGLCYWILEKHPLPALILGMAACYGCGSLWYFAQSGGGLGLIAMQCVVPYLIPDGVKLWLAWDLSKRLKKYV